ncbi:lysozyme inhibitor LprI family protein [Acuticoccus sp. MNP-M23]|uniref:lysozyme inhibitor LprI family protein n=1 Tax=Acuticoccus sp. MNP-M23 TaxID=3072793 RepID=UPI002814CFBC|nr:lysozyme inhibitor LprI family protein [Acuticoccus sp. MNP-M23]WMS42601.1 lysozyme inhibitor LprI family protein [Acuticoccus sp. MNP-M23]
MRTSVMAAMMLVAGAVGASAADMCDSEADCADAMTTADIVACNAKATARADDALNALWPKVVALYDLNSNADADKAALRKAQNDWIGFRDATCSAEGALADGGTIAGIYVEDCRCSVTASRVADFERMIANRSEGN